MYHILCGCISIGNSRFIYRATYGNPAYLYYLVQERTKAATQGPERTSKGSWTLLYPTLNSTLGYDLEGGPNTFGGFTAPIAALRMWSEKQALRLLLAL